MAKITIELDTVEDRSLIELLDKAKKDVDA